MNFYLILFYGKEGNDSVKKSKTGWIILLVVVLILASCGAVVAYFLHRKAVSGLFFESTTVNGYNVAQMSAREAMEMLRGEYSRPTVTLKEDGKEINTYTLEQLGYTVDETKLQGDLRDCIKKQNADLVNSLMEGNAFEVKVPFEFDDRKLENEIQVSKFGIERTASTNATLEFNGKTYYIEPETYGNELDDADVRVIVRDVADRLVAADLPQPDAVADIPKGLYFLPDVTIKDKELNRYMNAYNQYCQAKITYTFGTVKETLDWNTLKDWLIMEGDEAYISEEKIYDFVYSLADRYDTLYYPHTFTTHDGYEIHFETSDYGYRISKDGEADQLLADIQSNKTVSREPVYETRGYSRNGRDDFNGNYVEVNLSAQHLYLYIGGEYVYDCDVVSGLPRGGRETATGVYSIPYKASPFNLVGGGGSGAASWDVNVKYWMPFYDGQGLHDASWRSNFGGSIYMTNGSHGCVNLPEYAAATIYSYIDSNFPIILYK